MKIAAITMFLMLPTTALGEITGKPRIIDGDTMEIGGQAGKAARGTIWFSLTLPPLSSNLALHSDRLP